MKKRQILPVLLMAAVLYSLSAAAWTGGRSTFSYSERRELAKFPELSAQTVLDGSFMEEFEIYAMDQFPFREAFRRLKAEALFDLFRQKDSHGVYVAEGYASKMEYPLNEAMLDHAADRFQYLYDEYLGEAEHVYFSVIPDKNCFLAPKNGYLSLNYEELVQSMREKTEFMTYIDIFGTLELEDYYRTDTHWRQERLSETAKVLAEAMGASLNLEYEEKELELPFYGVYCGQSALPLKPDTIRYLTGGVLDSCTVTCYDSGEPEAIPMYDMEKAAGKDPYEMFLSGTRAILTIENPLVQNRRELIVFRDSFGSSLIPLLAEGYETITVIDIRYVDSRLLGDLVSFGGQDVLFLYSTLLLNNSMALK